MVKTKWRVTLKTVFAHPDFTDDYLWYTRLASLYDMVVVEENRGSQLDWLARLRHKEKFEIIVNLPCTPRCPMRVQHYNLMKDEECKPKTLKGRGILPELVRGLEMCRKRARNTPSLELPPRRVSALWRLGFRHFKIAVRNSPWPEWLDVTARNMIRPGNLLLRYLGLEEPEIREGRC